MDVTKARENEAARVSNVDKTVCFDRRKVPQAGRWNLEEVRAEEGRRIVVEFEKSRKEKGRGFRRKKGQR